MIHRYIIFITTRPTQTHLMILLYFITLNPLYVSNYVVNPRNLSKKWFDSQSRYESCHICVQNTVASLELWDICKVQVPKNNSMNDKKYIILALIKVSFTLPEAYTQSVFHYNQDVDQTQKYPQSPIFESQQCMRELWSFYK
jgi:hypothetical protein